MQSWSPPPPPTLPPGMQDPLALGARLWPLALWDPPWRCWHFPVPAPRPRPVCAEEPRAGSIEASDPAGGRSARRPPGLPAHREALPCPRLLSSSLASVATLESPHTSGRRTGRSSLSNKTVNQRSLVHASLKQMVPESSAGRCNPSQMRVRKERNLPVRLL